MSARLIVVTRNLPPLIGGMERLGLQAISSLAELYDVVVVGPPGCTAALPSTVHVTECGGNRPSIFLAGALLHTLRHALNTPRPAVVLALSGLTAPLARIAAGLAHAESVTVVHGLDLVADSRIYRRAFLPAIRSSALVIANSRATAEAAAACGVPLPRIRVVNPGVAWPPTLPERGRFRARHALGDRPLLLSIGRLAARKGIAELIRTALPRIVDAAPDVLLVVVGEEPRDAIRTERSQRARIEAAARDAGLTDHVRLLGRLPDADVAEACVDAQAFVFPLVPVPGDVEGFGMVAAEAAAHGLRTVAFDEGGVSDAVVPDLTGTLVTRGDYARFADAAIGYITDEDPASREACRSAAKRFDWPRYADELRSTIGEILRTETVS